MIHPQTRTLLEKFATIGVLQRYHATLIGGTALAYRLSHRQSFDLDICFPFADRLPTLDFLDLFDEVVPLAFDKAVVHTALDEGGDIHDVMRRFIVEGVKVDFVVNPSSNILENEILQDSEAEPFGTLRIASLETLFRLKTLLLMDRNKIRDLYDVVYMIEHCGFRGEEVIETIMRYRITYRSDDIVDLLSSRQEDPFDIEGIVDAKMEGFDYRSLQRKLLTHLKDTDS